MRGRELIGFECLREGVINGLRLVPMREGATTMGEKGGHRGLVSST